MRHGRLTIPALCCALAALSCRREEAETCALRARPLAAAVGFDANSDGALDVADGAWVLARHFRGGDDPPCLPAVEAFGDKVDDAVAAWSIWYALISGTAAPELAEGACAAPPDVEAACGDGLAMRVSADAGPSGAQGSTVEFQAEVLLDSPELPVEAWSVSLAASGCAVSAATLAGTLGADRRDAPPGARDGGVGHASLSAAGGAVSLVVLDPIGGGAVNPASEPILELTVRATVGAACAPCTLSLSDGQTGAGRPLTNAASSGGRSYAPETVDATVQVCPG